MNCAICLLKTWDMPKSIITGFCARDILSYICRGQISGAAGGHNRCPVAEGCNILARLSADKYRALPQRWPGLEYHALARVLTIRQKS